jgi:hypothetical protein
MAKSGDRAGRNRWSPLFICFVALLIMKRFAERIRMTQLHYPFFPEIPMPKNQYRTNLCHFTFADGRRCSMPQFPD